MHATLIVLTWYSKGIHFGFSHTLSIMACSGFGLYLYEKKYANIRNMQYSMLIMGLLCVSLPYAFIGQPLTEYYSVDNNKIMYIMYIILRIIHFIGMHVTYAILMWIIIHIVIMVFIENKLNGKDLKYKFEHSLLKQLSELPSLAHMYLILHKRLYILWICMTLVLITGISIYLYLYYFFNFGQKAMHIISHKTIFSVLAWLIFSVFLYQKHTYGLNSKQTIYYVLSICLLWILAYIGSDFVRHVLISSP